MRTEKTHFLQKSLCIWKSVQYYLFVVSKELKFSFPKCDIPKKGKDAFCGRTSLPNQRSTNQLSKKKKR